MSSLDSTAAPFASLQRLLRSFSLVALLIAGQTVAASRDTIECDGTACRVYCRPCPPETGCPAACHNGTGAFCAYDGVLSDEEVANFSYPSTCPGDCGPANCSTATSRCLPVLGPNGEASGATECVPKACRNSPKPEDPSRFNRMCGPRNSGEPPVGGNKGPNSLQCPVGGRRALGDPVTIGDGKSIYTVTDISLSTANGPLDFSRTFHSTHNEWLFESTLGTQSTPYVPTPFGGEYAKDWSIRWWHNWYSFVLRTSTDWLVRLPGGELVVFEPCTITSGNKCAARPRPRSAESRAVLTWDSAMPGFTYYGPTGVYRFASRHLTDRFYLTTATPRPGSGLPTAFVEYGAPSGCQATPGMDSTTFVPFVAKVSSAGLSMRFEYVNRGPVDRSWSQQQCVLRKVRICNENSQACSDAVEFTYDSGDTAAGLIWQAKNYLKPPASGALFSVETYVYTSTEFRAHRGSDSSNPNLAFLRHVQLVGSGEAEPATAVVSSAYSSAGGELTYVAAELQRVRWPGVGSCPPNASCSNATPLQWSNSVPNRTLGTGAYSLASDTLVTNQSVPGDLSTYRTTAQANLATSGLDTTTPGTASETFEIENTANGPYNAKVSSARSDTVVVASAVANSPHIAVTSRSVGRNSGPGAAVETETFAYEYRPLEYAGGNYITEQRVSTTERTSVLPTAPVGSKARSTLRHDSDGRVVASIREGYTRTATVTTPPTWSDVKRYEATFYFYTPPGGGYPDEYGRPVETHGPCFVASPDDTDCQAPFPVTRYTYSSGGAGGIYKIERVVPGLATPLTTWFQNHDEFGHAQTTIDEGGTTRTYTYQSDRPTSMTVVTPTGNRTYSYVWDRGHLTRIQRPEGDFDIICYRRGATLGAGCPADGNPSEEPTYIFRYAQGQGGGSWYEATRLTYATDGELRSTEVFQAGMTWIPFLQTTVERNPLGFTTFEKLGPTPNGTVERTTRQFAPDGLVVAQSSPYFNAPDFCGAAGAPDELCTKFSYWNTGRLKQMVVKPLSGAADISVCLDYDAHGNVIGVKPGCSGVASDQHQYISDDFGRVIEARLANVDAPIRYEYNALGNVVRKAIPNGASNATLLEWDFDVLGRPKENRENGTVVLRWYYDNVGTPTAPTGCATLASTQYQTGRLTLASDAVWNTWYSYDAEGRVIREARVARALEQIPNPACSAMALDTNQVLERTYTPNGNVASVTYPSGRLVSYSYDTSARPTSVAMKTWTGSAWTAPLTMLANITWLPAGTLKSYDVLSYTSPGSSPTTLSVSYRYGGDGYTASSPTTPIPTTSCAWATDPPEGLGDSSGRLRAIYVMRDSMPALRLFYRWKGEQVVETSRCYSTAAVPLWEQMDETAQSSTTEFQYDRAGRLGGADLTTYDSAGGYGYKRSYVYDTRGNRTRTKQYGNSGYDFVYGDASKPDRMTRVAVNDGTTSDGIIAWARNASGQAVVPVRSGRARNYSYDSLGRVTAIWGAFGTLEPFSNNAGTVVSGTETVMRSVTTPAGAFNYFYDSQNQRVRKQYPNGDLDGFFWGSGKELLMETSVQLDLPGGNSWQPVMDEYIWLAGRPLLSIRSSFTKSLSNPPTWAALADWTASCTRRGVAGTCRPNAILSDVIGKPVATFDSSRNIAGVLEYDPYGAVNRAEHWGEIAPHPNGAPNCWWVTSWMKQGNGPLVREVRAVLPRVDIPSYTGNGGGCIGQYKSNPSQNPYGAPAGNDTCGPKADFKFGWTTLADTEGLHVLYCSYDNNLSPQPAGVTVRGYDYKKYEAGAVHYMPPFRFPGQYFDEETDFHENWNRYYEPLTGRYLSHEPLLQNPDWVASELQSGHPLPAYSYARNNPVMVVDPNGKTPAAAVVVGGAVGVGAAVLAGASLWCLAYPASCRSAIRRIGDDIFPPTATPASRPGTRPGARPVDECEPEPGQPNDSICDYIATLEYELCMAASGNPTLCARYAAAEWMKCNLLKLPRPPDRFWPH